MLISLPTPEDLGVSCPAGTTGWCAVRRGLRSAFVVSGVQLLSAKWVLFMRQTCL